MSQRYLGGVITANPTTPTLASLSGVWTLEQQFQYFNVWSPEIVGNSVRLRSSASAYFNRTPSTASNRRTWTWSGWVKLGSLASGFSFLTQYTDSNNQSQARIRADGVLRFYDLVSGSFTTDIYWSPVYRDPSSWYHLMLVADTTQATNTNRIKFYVNGVQVTSTSSATWPSQNTDLRVNLNAAHFIGQNGANNEYADGYLAEVNFVDGQALTPSSFGAFDSTGVWQPLPYTGTYGTNGYYLTFADNSAATAAALGKDTSGNGNNWTPNNISLTAGTTYDWMLDSPTNWIGAAGGNGVANYCVLNPVSNGLGVAPSNGNMRQSGVSAVTSRINSTIGVSSGKWYFEATLTTASSFTTVGIGQNNITNQYPGNDALSYAQALENANSINNNVQPSYGTAFSSGDVFICAFDLDNNKLFFGRNGTWFGSSDPAAGTNPVYTLTAGTYNVIARPNPSGFASGAVLDFNFGQRPFAYTPPTGFKALNTLNLPTPTIMRGSQYMDINLWTGDQAARTITNSGAMQPDFLWTKSRSNVEDHRLSDSVRGGNGTVLGTLASNTTGAEAFDTDVTGFTSTGFNIRAGTNSPNVTGRTYVGWQWQAGRGTTSSNTNGTITSTVSANTTAGFSVVTYTGTGANATVGHGLGVAPKMVILKNRGSATNWKVWQTAIAGTEYLEINNTTAKQTAATVWNSTVPTSSVFSIGTSGDVNSNGGTYVAYCFAAVTGYSAFGSYTGNGSSDGPFVFCGLRPRWIMVKRTDVSDSWLVFDTARLGYNGGNVALVPNSSGAEGSTSYIDILSNGFKARQSNTEINASGGTYIYACFAENPFNISRAR